ncbi:MAG TPA: hypothetical protein VN749_01525 [Candidatus Eisenbacteria bacterium]|jgi:hypothetical protein|nr:hypothetical protein [Candidatus Eisenbacteria bacterium]
MSASASRTAFTQNPLQQARAFLRIVRHGTGPGAVYVLTYHRLDGSNAVSKPLLAEGAQPLLDLLDRIGVDFRSNEVRGALEDILRLGSANIPDLWLSDEEMLQKGLVEG